MNENGTFPGKYKTYGANYWVVSCRDDTTLVPSGQEEYIAFDFSSCRYAWVPYTTSQPLPHGAVKGGFAGGVGLFIARGYETHNNGQVIPATGYYNPATQRGYFKLSDFCDTRDTMEILVLLWQWWAHFCKLLANWWKYLCDICGRRHGHKRNILFPIVPTCRTLFTLIPIPTLI